MSAPVLSRRDWRVNRLAGACRYLSRFGHAGQLDRGSERWTVTRSAGDWTSSSAPTRGVGKAHHATAIPLMGMARYRDFVRGSLLRNWTSSSAPTHGVGKAPMPLSIKIRAWALPRFRPRIPPQAVCAAHAMNPSSSAGVAHMGRTHGQALVRARGTCAYGTVAGALARARGTCAHGTNRRALRKAAPARSAGGERERSRAVERGGAAKRQDGAGSSRGVRRAGEARAAATQHRRQWRRRVYRALNEGNCRHGRPAASGNAAAVSGGQTRREPTQRRTGASGDAACTVQ